LRYFNLAVSNGPGRFFLTFCTHKDIEKSISEYQKQNDSIENSYQFLTEEGRRGLCRGRKQFIVATKKILELKAKGENSMTRNISNQDEFSRSNGK